MSQSLQKQIVLLSTTLLLLPTGESSALNKADMSSAKSGFSSYINTSLKSWGCFCIKCKSPRHSRPSLNLDKQNMYQMWNNDKIVLVICQVKISVHSYTHCSKESLNLFSMKNLVADSTKLSLSSSVWMCHRDPSILNWSDASIIAHCASFTFCANWI